MNKYAGVYWTVADVLQAAERAELSITDEQAEEFLSCIEDVLQDRMVQAGWNVIDDRLPDYV